MAREGAVACAQETPGLMGWRSVTIRSAVAFTATFTARLNGGKIEEQWVNFDALGLLRQIDGVAAPA